MGNLRNVVTFNELKWDTEFFGVTSAKAILHRPLTLNKWAELKSRFKNYQFISILNENSEPVNTQLIGKDTSAFLADVNIQFKKKLEGTVEMPQNVTFHEVLERNNEIIDLASFKFSKFIEDPEFAKRGGEKVYQHWLINSFDKPGKFFALSKGSNGDINGFVLYSFTNTTCVIELIAVSQKVSNGGIGTSLFTAVEYSAYQKKCKEIEVGTQIRNMGAINFYQKVGCKQKACHQVYHLWNL